MEYGREIRQERLHLTHRHFGVQASDAAQQNGAALVSFANSQDIKAIRTDVTVPTSYRFWSSFVRTTAFQSISSPNPSLTATERFCSVPRYRSVVCTDACPSSN